MFKVGSYITFRTEQEFNDRFYYMKDVKVIKKNNKWNDIYKIIEIQNNVVIVQFKNYPPLLKVSKNRLNLASNIILTSRRTHVKNNTPS